MTIISGICPVEHLGAGRVIRFIESQLHKFPSARLNYAGNKSGVSALLRKRRYAKVPLAVALHFLRRARLYRNLGDYCKQDHLLLMHFQEIGLDWCVRLLRNRVSDRPVWFFLFDSAFFCRKSYNHLEFENSECLRCLGGGFDEALRNRCVSFPRKSRVTTPFLRMLRAAAVEGNAAFFAQNAAQHRLAKSHFGEEATVVTSGVWMDDFNDLLTLPVPTLAQVGASSVSFDIVFHANPQSAKGFRWALKLAAELPRLQFLFPCALPQGLDVPGNCTFRPLRWDSGLAEAVSTAKITLLPSLWSAPVEGALLISLLIARVVAVVDVPSAYSSELPDELVLKLPPATTSAAETILRFLSNPQHIHRQMLFDDWRKRFQNNRFFLSRICESIGAVQD